MRKGAFKPVSGQGMGGEAWRLSDRARPRPRQAPSVYVIGNGFIGVRGLPEESEDSATTYLNAVYERVPIRYHESAHGFAEASDTRLPAANALRWEIEIDGVRFGPAAGETLAEEWALDFRTGLVSRLLRWRSPAGQEFEIQFERLAALERPALLAHRIRLRPLTGGARVALTTFLDPPRVNGPAAGEELYDPRLGPALEHAPWSFQRWIAEGEAAGRVDRLRNSGFEVAAAVRVPGLVGAAEGDLLAWRTSAEIAQGGELRCEKLTAYACDRGVAGRNPEAEALEALAWGEAQGFDGLLASQARVLARYWAAAEINLPGHPALERAIRFNQLQLFQAVGTDSESSIAAKGQTGEGYEGHVFWDADSFMLPMFALLAPERARSMLEYRARGLASARRIARTMGHKRGALYPWRTIGGEECSAFFPAGSAQYHINADIAYALRTYVAATGDLALMDEFGLELLVETARVWLDMGHFRGGQFCIDKVTGPDEYSALVDNNYYTNAMAKAHLLDAAGQAEAMAARNPAGYQALCARIGLEPAELAQMRAAAGAMRLPVCPELGILAQDDAFLSKKVWDFAGTPESKYPLLLHHHPLTIYRHQVCKQADAVLALSMAGRELDPELKRRTLHYYEAVTTHDSTLSPSGFAVAAAQLGECDKAFDYLRMTAFVDLEDLCGNADHGLHMAAMAGSWLAPAFGFAGLDLEGGLAFQPRFCAALGPYTLRLRYQGRLLELSVAAEGACYRLLEGPALPLRHCGERILLEPGGELRGARLA